MKSRKALFEVVKNIPGAIVPKTHKDFSNETYGPKSMIYLEFDTINNRLSGEMLLESNGFKVNKGYYKGSKITEIQVSYFKGDRWWE